MKKSFKFLTILFAVILLCGIAAVSVMAADASDTETVTSNQPDYYFQVYNIETGKLTKYANKEDFDTTLKGITSDSIVTLLKDIEETDNNNIIYIGGGADSSNPVKIYWDLNGHYYSFVRNKTTGGSVSMDIKDYVELNVYSSQPRGRIFNYHKNEEGAYKCLALFNLRYSNAALNLGGITVPFEFDYTNGTYAADKTTTYSGDNLSTSSAGLVRITDNGSNDKNIKVNINGGSYYHNTTGTPLIYFTANEADGAEPSLTVKNAKFISTYGEILTVKKENKNSSSPTGNSSYESCTFYAPNGLFESYAPTHTLSFKDCSFIGNIGNFDAAISIENCKAVGGVAFPTDVAHINQTVELDVGSYEFSYNNDGTVNADSYTNKSTDNKKITYILQSVSESTDYATIVWDAEAILGDGEKVTEKWLLGETPISPIPIPDATSVYRYAFPGVTEVTADMVGKITTYTLTGYANFGIKANLNLSEKFTFNIYVPAEVWGSVNPESIKIGSTEATAEKTNIDGKEYYILTHSINANKAYEVFTLEIELIGYKGKAFTHFYTFSIPDYIDKIQEGEYTQEAKALMDATENYIAAVDNFANNGENEINVTYSPTKEGNTSGVTDLESVQLVLGEAIVIRFNADTAVAMTLVLPCQNGTSTSTREVTVSESDWSGSENAYYYDVTLPVKFLNDGITVTVGNQSGIFYLDDYINWVKENEAGNGDLVTLVNAIGAYSAAAKAYAQSEGNQTPVVKFTVAGNEITQIVYNSENEKSVAAANRLKDIIESKTGKTLTFTSDTEISNTDNAICLSLVEPTAEYDYRITVDGTNLVINCSFASFVDKATELFVNDVIKYTDKNVDFATDYKKDYYTAKIYYSDFGAAGNASNESDNNTDDFFALKATHDFANMTKRHTVYADPDATYYIHETRANGGTGSAQTITVKTDVDWGNAKFIIDDSDIGYNDGTDRATKNIFEIISDYEKLTITDTEVLNSLGSIGEGTDRIDLGLGYPALLTVYNEDHKVYRRYGGYSASEQAGVSQQEVILIDENGYVDESTPFMFDYAKVTFLYIRRVDIEPITITGGEFTTKASRVNIYQNVYDEAGNVTATTVNKEYFTRGINVNRSYTTLKDVKHYVVGEITTVEQNAGTTDERGNTISYAGAAYRGFFYAESATDVTFEDCVLTGRRYYNVAGTYDFGADRVNRIILDGCVQSNFWMTLDESGTPTGQVTVGIDSETGLKTFNSANDNAVLSMSYINLGDSYNERICWGIGGTNHCKNMEYQNSLLSRFDAHCGLLNGKIVDSTVSFMSLVGKGEMLIENTTWISVGTGTTDNSMIRLREDYGSPWEGTITIRDCTAQNTSGTTYLIYHNYANWDFGYTCYFPNIIVDNLKFTNTDSVTFLWSSNWDDNIHEGTYKGTTNLNKVVPPEFIKIINNKSGETYTDIHNYDNNNFFSTTYIAIDTNGDTTPEIEYHTEYKTTEVTEEDSPIISMN